MKFIKYLTIPAVIAFMISILSGCEDKGSNLSKAVLASSSALTFDVDGGTQTITVYADADWLCDYPDWITVSPSSGNCVVDVDITVSANYSGGEPDTPRQETVIFYGQGLSSQASVIVYQDGNKYRYVQTYTIDQIGSLADDDVASLPNVYVAAITTNGFIATNAAGTSNILITSEESVKVGDEVTVTGVKSSSNGLPTLSAEQFTKISSGNTITYPTPTDVTLLLDTYSSSNWDYITLTGNINGTIITVEDCVYNVNIVFTDESLGYNDLAYHDVQITGYFAGVAAPYLRIVGTELEDLGSSNAHYFFDDFDWLEYYAEMYGAEDNVGTGVSTSNAPNIYQDAPEAQVALDERGYDFVCDPSGHAHYLQPYCLKFGRTNYEGGIILPLIEGVPANTDVVLSFDWVPMRGGSYKYDITQLEVLVGETSIDNFQHNKENGDTGPLEYIHVECPISSYTSSEYTRITIRSYPWGEHPATLERWFLDNVSVDKAGAE